MEKLVPSTHSMLHMKATMYNKLISFKNNTYHSEVLLHHEKGNNQCEERPEKRSDRQVEWALEVCVYFNHQKPLVMYTEVTCKIGKRKAIATGSTQMVWLQGEYP